MANSIALVILQGPTNAVPLATPITRNFTAANIMYYVADAKTGITNATARVFIRLGKANGNQTGEYIVSNDLTTSLAAQLSTFVSIATYNGAQGDARIAATATTVFYNPSLIQFYFADANTGYTGVVTQVNMKIARGNGSATFDLLSSTTAAAITTALG